MGKEPILFEKEISLDKDGNYKIDDLTDKNLNNLVTKFVKKLGPIAEGKHFKPFTQEHFPNEFRTFLDSIQEPRKRIIFEPPKYPSEIKEESKWVCPLPTPLATATKPPSEPVPALLAKKPQAEPVPVTPEQKPSPESVLVTPVQKPPVNVPQQAPLKMIPESELKSTTSNILKKYLAPDLVGKVATEVLSALQPYLVTSNKTNGLRIV